MIYSKKAIKEAFQKVKQDTDFLKQEIDLLKSNLKNTKELLIETNELVKNLIKNKVNKQTDTSTDKPLNQTIPTHFSTDNSYLEPLKDQNIGISTGNEGVPTDRQTDTSTDRQTQKTPFENKNIRKFNTSGESLKMQDALEILNSLDNLKKEVRLKFKRLTDQEFLVFSTLYQFDEEKGYSSYNSLAKKLNLSESSIRDYIGRLIKKGIPIEKKRINNKNIHLSISQNLKKIATLPTILQLRDL